MGMVTGKHAALPAAASTPTLAVHTLAHCLASTLPTASAAFCAPDAQRFGHYFNSNSTDMNVHLHWTPVLPKAAAQLVLQANHATTERCATRLQPIELHYIISTHIQSGSTLAYTRLWAVA